ncbi:MAG: hypothetical protein GX312_03430, partial [Candidatus Phytoplasma sp.]|nr:hypothetical protein [Phytoplasma sp.]
YNDSDRFNYGRYSSFSIERSSFIWNYIGNWFQNHRKELVIGTTFIVVGTLIKIGNLARTGKNIRLDAGVKSLLHMNVQFGANYHIIICQYLAGIIEGIF